MKTPLEILVLVSSMLCAACGTVRKAATEERHRATVSAADSIATKALVSHSLADTGELTEMHILVEEFSSPDTVRNSPTPPPIARRTTVSLTRSRTSSASRTVAVRDSMAVSERDSVTEDTTKSEETATTVNTADSFSKGMRRISIVVLTASLAALLIYTRLRRNEAEEE